MKTIHQIALSVFSGLAGAILFVSLDNHINEKTIAGIALDTVITEHIKLYGEQADSDEKRKQMGSQFAQALDLAIAEVSERDGVVLLASGAIVSAGVPDYTEEVSLMVKGYMDAQHN